MDVRFWRLKSIPALKGLIWEMTGDVGVISTPGAENEHFIKSPGFLSSPSVYNPEPWLNASIPPLTFSGPQAGFVIRLYFRRRLWILPFARGR